MSPSLAPLGPGSVLRTYHLLRLLGVGGDGEVWLARDNRGEEVALKARPQPGPTEEARLFREFEHLRALRIPGVVRVLDAGLDQGYVFFTMDVAHGQTFDLHVAAEVDPNRRWLRVVHAAAGVARALAAIHRLGLAHRDIKPANVMVGEDGRVTVLDFGTARIGFGGGGASDVCGTLAYMAPEQRLGHPHGPPVDVYALGVTLHEALSGIPARGFGPTSPRPVLIATQREIPPTLDRLVQRMVCLDPAERPSAAQVEEELQRVEQGLVEPGSPWPEPPTFQGEVGTLMEGSAVVLGKPGSGRRRTVQEARRLWFRKGYRSLAGQCIPDRPFLPLQQLLAALFSDRDERLLAELRPEEARLLEAVWPELPVEVEVPEPWPPDPLEVAQAMARLLSTREPLALAVWDLDQADLGTTAVLASLVRILPDNVRLWATARRTHLGLPVVRPPEWTPARHEALLLELVGEGPNLVGHRARSPLQSCVAGWHYLARVSGRPLPPPTLPESLGPLTVLEEPFPVDVARSLVPDVDELVGEGHLLFHEPLLPASLPAPSQEEPDTEGTAPHILTRLVFAHHGTRLLARSELANPEAAHLAAARAWNEAKDHPDHLLKGASHAVWGGQPESEVLDAAVRLEAERGSPAEVDRWIRLRDLGHGAEDDFMLAYARLYAALELRPRQVQIQDLRALAGQAHTPVERGLAAYLRLIHEARGSEPERAIELGRRWVRALRVPYPAIAAQMLREVALAGLAAGHAEDAVVDCKKALALARDAARAMPRGVGHRQGLPLTPPEVGAGTTLSAALLYTGRTAEAVALCRDLAQRCREAGMHRGEGAMRANQAIGQLYLGDRTAAAEACAASRAVFPRHLDPLILAHVAVVEARLTVERGEVAAARPLIDEALSAGRSGADERVMGEAWAVVLEAAIHTMDVAEAQRALAAYGSGSRRSPRDAWPATLGRWLWFVGDLPAALKATNAHREGHGGLCTRAEHARLLLVAGHYREAHRAARSVAIEADAFGFLELAIFARLVAGAAMGAPDELFAPVLKHTFTSRWVHLYLGGLHLDAIRRQLRGQDVKPIIRRLHRRASDMGHRLYMALGRPEAW